MIAIVGRHPHETAGFDELALEEIERAAAHPRARAIGETGLDYYRDHAPRDDQRRAFEAQLELAARTQLPVVIHTRAAEDDTFALLREHAGSLPAVILHCFSAPDRLERVRRAGLPLLVRRQRDLPEGHRPPGGRARGAGRAAARGDRLALPGAAAGARQAERAGERDPHRPLRGGAARRSSTRSSSGRWTRTPRACSGREAASRARPACGGCAAFGIRPNRELGQNFLIDDNILRVIGSAAELDAERRGARGGRRARRALGVPRAAGRAPARGGGGPLARAAAARGARARSTTRRSTSPTR